MSRVGKASIKCPGTVKVNVSGRDVRVEGPKGKLEYQLPREITLQAKDGVLTLAASGESKKMKSLHGVSRTMISNMVHGVTGGYRKELQIIGMGYRAQAQGKTLNLQVGFSHPVPFAVPDDVKIETPAPTQIVVSGVDKQRVGQVAASIRDVLRPEPYKGKGIRYTGEYVRHKAGKAVTGAK